MAGYLARSARLKRVNRVREQATIAAPNERGRRKNQKDNISRIGRSI